MCKRQLLMQQLLIIPNVIYVESVNPIIVKMCYITTMRFTNFNDHTHK